jgi:hypothetical protein
MFFIKLCLCVFLNEVKLFKQKIEYIKFILYRTNIYHLFIYFFINKKNIPIKDDYFKEFLKINTLKWKKIDKKFSNRKNQYILVENVINQPQCNINNLIVARLISNKFNINCIGLLKRGDFKNEELFKSFGIKKFYYYKNPNIFFRCIYIIRSLNMLKKINTVKEFCNIKINNIDVGLAAYDTYIRYTGIPNPKKISNKMVNFFADSLFANDYFDKIYTNKKITKLVQAEKQFIPLTLSFQNALKKHKIVYARFGTDRITVRIYNNFKQRYDSKNKYSNKLLKIVNDNFKTQSIKKINKFYQQQFKHKLYGNAWSHYIKLNKKVVNKWKNTNDPHFSKSLKLKKFDLNKNQICEKFNWEKNKKIVTVYLPYIIDANFAHGRKNLYPDNCSWILNTFEIIKSLKNVNWLIRPHPNEYRYSSKINLNKIISELESKNPNIKLAPTNLNPVSIVKFTDIALTSHGSVGIEYPTQGKNCIVSEKSYYTHCNINIIPKNIKSYKKILHNAHKIKKISQSKIVRAKLYFFIFLNLAKVNNTFLPEHLPIFEARMREEDEKIFWSRSIKTCRDFNYFSNELNKMLMNQIDYNARHTVNNDFFKVYKKKINDR